MIDITDYVNGENPGVVEEWEKVVGFHHYWFGVDDKHRYYFGHRYHDELVGFFLLDRKDFEKFLNEKEWIQTTFPANDITDWMFPNKRQ